MKNFLHKVICLSLITSLGCSLYAENPLKKAGDAVKEVGEAAKGKVEAGLGREAANVGEEALKDMGKDAVEGAKETVKESGQQIGGMFFNAYTYLKDTLIAYTPESVVTYLNEHPQAQTALVLAGGAGVCWFLYNYGGPIANKLGQATDYLLDTVKTHKKKALAATLLLAVWYANSKGYFTQGAAAEGAEKVGEFVEGAKEVGQNVADKVSDTASQVKEGAKQMIHDATPTPEGIEDKAEALKGEFSKLVDKMAAFSAPKAEAVREKTA